MACVNPDGRPTDNGLKMLQAIAQESLAPEAVATKTSLPLFRIRSGLRELEAAGLATSDGGAYRATEKGAGLLT